MQTAIGLQYNFETAVNPFDWEKFSLAFMPYFIQALNEIRGEIQNRIPVGRYGDARRDVSTTPPEREGFTIRGMVIPTPGSKSERYAYYVENGRAPGKMPPWGVGSSLLEWVQQQIRNEAGPFGTQSARSIKFTRNLRKGEEGYSNRGASLTTRKGTPQQLTPQGKEALQMSFLIARAIGKHGTKRFRGLVPAPWATGFEAGMAKAQEILEMGVREAFAQIR